MPLRPLVPAAITLVLLALTGPLAAQSSDNLPGFTYEDAINCKAYKAADMEASTTAPNDNDAVEMAFWDSVITAKGSSEPATAREAAYAEALVQARAMRAGVGMTAEETDELLTGIGKFCWFQALAAEGGPFFEE